MACAGGDETARVVVEDVDEDDDPPPNRFNLAWRAASAVISAAALHAGVFFERERIQEVHVDITITYHNNNIIKKLRGRSIE
jgi:hypothetical protein